jgi:UDP-glucose 4-epimerase
LSGAEAAPGPFRERRVLVTGGLGFIGSNLTLRLLAEGARVRVLDALTAGDGGNRFNLAGAEPSERLEIVEDRVDERSVADAAVDGCEVVFHLAGKVSHVESMEDPMADLRANAATTIAVLDACRRVNPRARIVVAGTRQVYGPPLRLPVDEGHPLRPVDYNGVSKIAAEHYAKVAAERLGLSTTVLRLTNVYGPRQLVSHSRASFTGWLVRNAIRGDTIELFGTGRQRRDLLYVDDAVEAFLLAARKLPGNGEAWNCGREDTVSLHEFAGTLVRLAGGGRVVEVPFPPERQRIDIGDFATDARRLRDATGWRATIDLEEGLSRTVAFFRAHGERYWEAAS